MRNRVILVLCCAALFAPLRLSAQEEHEHHGDNEQLGTVIFPNSCSPDSQESFVHAVALMHSFQYTAAENAFVEVAASDKHCAMACWGEAMALYHQLWDQPKMKTLKAGRKDLKEARKINPKTERETQFIDAALLFFDTNSKHDYDTRAHRYSDAMADMYAKYPDDSEVAAFYALSLLTWDQPGDKNYANRRKAIEVLNKLYAAQPNHPGAAHYLIHSADRPELAPLALAAARRYAQIAPGSSHAIHMPSHIFSRLGLWQESIESNTAAAAAAEREINAHLAEAHYEFHPMDYLEYAYLQIGREKDAWGVIEKVDTVPGASDATRAAVKNFFTARYYLECMIGRKQPRCQFRAFLRARKESTATGPRRSARRAVAMPPARAMLSQITGLSMTARMSIALPQRARLPPSARKQKRGRCMRTGKKTMR